MERIYLVTGAYGHLGNVIIRNLLADKQKVRALVLPNDINDMFALMPVSIYRGDVTKKETLIPFFEHTENEELIVIHCAGIISIYAQYSKLTHDVNVGGTKNMVDLAIEYGVKRFVYVSSVHALKEKPKGEIISEQDYFDPSDVEGDYAKTKSEASQYVLNAQGKLDVVIVHPSGIIGPYDFYEGNTTKLFESFIQGTLRVIVKGGYDFVDVRDVASGILAASEKGRRGECYILSNRYITIKDMFDALSIVGNVKRIRIVLPVWIPRMVAPIFEKHYQKKKQVPLYTGYSLSTIKSNSFYSHQKATNELGYQPRSILETMSSIYQWIYAKKVTKLTIKPA